jgi:hypothetical protein
MNDQRLDASRAHSHNALWTAREEARDLQNGLESWQAEKDMIWADIRACMLCRREANEFDIKVWRHCEPHLRELADHNEYRPR